LEELIQFVRESREADKKSIVEKEKEKLASDSAAAAATESSAVLNEISIRQIELIQVEISSLVHKYDEGIKNQSIQLNEFKSDLHHELNELMLASASASASASVAAAAAEAAAEASAAARSKAE